MMKRYVAESGTLGRVARFVALPAASQRLFLQAGVYLPLAALGVRLLGLKRLMGRLERFGHGARRWASVELEAAAAEETRQMVHLASRYGLFHGNCLSRSLTLWWLLRGEGILSRLRLGVRKRGGDFEAHAWVEYRGQVFNDSPSVLLRFAPFDQPLPLPE